LNHPPLDVLAVYLLPAGPAGLPAQVGGGEPLHRLGVGPDRLGGLALGGQARHISAVTQPAFPASSTAHAAINHPCFPRQRRPALSGLDSARRNVKRAIAGLTGSPMRRANEHQARLQTYERPETSASGEKIALNYVLMTAAADTVPQSA